MGTITTSLPADGETADVSDYNVPITTIVNEFNGNIDDANIKVGAAIDGGKIADTSIPTAKLEDDAVTDAKLGADARLASKIITATRDLTAASGDVAYTGVGFVPTAIIAFTNVTGGYKFNIGMADSARGMARVGQYGANTLNNATTAVCYISDGTNAQSAVLKSYDADGFTLTWTKTASPTGTANLLFLCFR